MSIASGSKYTIGGTTTETTQPGFAADVRLYDNESTYVGENAAPSNNYGIRNTVLGYEAWAAAGARGSCNLVAGFQSCPYLEGNNNTILGTVAAAALRQASDNVVIGAGAFATVKRCVGNVAIGGGAGSAVSEGDLNTLIGHRVWSGSVASVISHGNTVVGARCDGWGTSNTILGVGHETLDGAHNCIVAGANNVLGAGACNNIVLGSGMDVQGSGCIVIGQGIKSTGDGVLNIANKITGTTRSLVLTSDAITIKTNQNSILDLDEYNVRVNARSLFNVRCAAQFESPVALKDHVDIYKLNVQSTCAFNSNIAIRSGDRDYWKIGLINRTATADGSKRGADLAFVSANNTVFTITDDFQPEVLNFTGKHRCKLVGSEAVDVLPGMVVVATGEYCNLDDVEAPSIDESIPVVALSTEAMDSRAFGVLCAMESDNEPHRSFSIGNIRFNTHKKSPRIIVNSVGEGGILVCDEGGPVRNGDLLTTSSRPGYTRRQMPDANIYMSHTVAKATCDCVFGVNGTAFIGCTYKF